MVLKNSMMMQHFICQKLQKLKNQQDSLTHTMGAAITLTFTRTEQWLILAVETQSAKQEAKNVLSNGLIPTMLHLKALLLSLGNHTWLMASLPPSSSTVMALSMIKPTQPPFVKQEAILAFQHGLQTILLSKLLSQSMEYNLNTSFMVQEKLLTLMEKSWLRLVVKPGCKTGLNLKFMRQFPSMVLRLIESTKMAKY